MQNKPSRPEPKTAEERAERCLPGCYDPTGKECSADERCEIHFRVAQEIQQAIDEAREEGKRDSIIEFCEGDRSLLAEYEAKAYEKGRAEVQSSTCDEEGHVLPCGCHCHLREEKARAEGYESARVDLAAIHGAKWAKEDYAQGFSDARAEAISRCETQEKIHHQYADSYEEALRDMADLLCQAMNALQPSKK